MILLTPFLLGFLLGILAGRSCSRTKDIETEAEPQTESVSEEVPDDISDGSEETLGEEIIYNRSRPPYSKWFDDLNDRHLSAAQTLGVMVPKTRSDVHSRKLVKIEGNKYYEIDKLNYSVPYLTKGAEDELNTIAKAFSDSLESKKLLKYKLLVSSVLRTEEDVRRLKRSGNPNASDRSAHCHGTTFDITYTRYIPIVDESEAFMQPFELTKVLGEVLRDQKNLNRCLVKYERKEHCFHITSLVSR